MLSKGGYANPMSNQRLTNKELSQTIEALLINYGFKIFDFSERHNIDSGIDKLVIRNPEYISIYKKSAKNTFLIIDYDKEIRKRVEVKLQTTSGSVDQKFPFLYLNAALALPEQDDMIFILEGKGYSNQSLKWLKEVSENGWLLEKGKKINVMSLGEFYEFIDSIYGTEVEYVQ